MHPALSVIFFTTLSGAGFGMWCWLGLRIALGPPPQGFAGLGWWLLLAVAGVLAAAGLLASFWHLGKPLRAWRAFTQWRTSWLSREGVCAAACFPVAFALAYALPALASGPAIATRALGLLLAGLAVATIYCTAMIYASLRTLPAWSHRLVPPVYLLYAALTGGLPLLLVQGLPRSGLDAWLAPSLILVALALGVAKLAYWRDIDRQGLPANRGDAVGLPGRNVHVFERPHTEANYITREMGFVLARRHARPLRVLAWLASAPLPALAIGLAWLSPGHALFALPAGLAAALVGAFVERWLFFAQARHVVTLYY